MIKNLLKLAVFLVIGVLVYNYFFGNAVEKERSAKIGNQVKELFQSAVDVVKDEKEKFDAGKYDGALDKVGDAIKKDNLEKEQKRIKLDISKLIDKAKKVMEALE